MAYTLTYTLIDNNTHYEVSGYTGTPPISVAIPATYEGKPVTKIGSSAFYKCSSLTSITIPNSVTSIGDDVFSDCINLKEIRYLGTKKEALTKLNVKIKGWRGDSLIEKIICTDGVIEL